MQTRLRKGMKRLIGMMLAAVLSLTGILPAFAAETGKVVGNTFDLEVGDILQPGDVITLTDWEPYENVAYFDYTGDGLDYMYSSVLDHSYISFKDALDNNQYESDRFVIKEYKKGEKALANEPSQLIADDFGGWMVMARRAETISSGNYGYLILMAVPKTVKKEVTCTSYSKEPYEPGAPEGAGVVLYSYDLKSGVLRKSDEKGTLKVSPGDVVYAVSKPVEKYYSEVEVFVQGSENLLKNQVSILEWYPGEDGIPARREYRPKLPGFIPADEADAVIAFVAPCKDVVVKATYFPVDEKCKVTYYDYEYKGSPVSIHEDTVWFNGKMKLWDPTKTVARYKDDPKAFLFWKRYKDWEYRNEYYLADEEIRVCENYVLDIKDENTSDCWIELGDIPFNCYFYNKRGQEYSTVQAQRVKNEDFILIPDKTKLPAGKSIMNVIYEAYGKKMIDDELGYDGSSRMWREAFEDDDLDEIKVSVAYYDQATDYVIDLTKEHDLLYYNDKEQKELRMKMYALSDVINGRRISAAETHTFYSFLDDNPYAMGYTILDLNGDGIGDVQDYWGYFHEEAIHAYDMELYELKHLGGAKLCEKNSYEIPVWVGGIGTVTIKLFDTCKVTYFDGDKTVTTQEVRKGQSLEKPATEAAVTKKGFTFKGWSTEKDGSKLYDFAKPVDADLKLYAVWEQSVAVNDVVKDEKTGNTFVVTATGEKNEVTLKEAAVKKGTVTVPGTIQIGGKEYQVTAIDKGAFKKASSMKTLDLGVNIAKVLKGTFKNCKKLKVIKIRNKKKVLALKKNMFGKFKGKITLKVPKKMVKKYKQYIKKKKLTKYFKIAKL